MITTFSSAILCSYAYQPEPLVHHLLWNIKSQYWWLWNRPELCNVCCWRDRGVDAEHGETIGSVAGTTDPEAGAVERRWRQRTPDTSGQWSPHSVCSPLPTFSHSRGDEWQSEDWSVNFPLYLYQWNEKLLPLKNMFTTKLWPHSDINIVLHNKSVKPKHTYTNASFYCKHWLVNSRTGHSRMETFHQSYNRDDLML